MENALIEFIKTIEARITPLNKASNFAFFNASISGKQEDYDTAADLKTKHEKVFTSKEDFEKLKKFKSSGKIKTKLLRRQLDILYNQYLSHQVNEKLLEEIIHLQTKIENKFSVFRTDFNGLPKTDNEVDYILKTSTDQYDALYAWLFSKQIGNRVGDDLIKLVKKRNNVARDLGFNNYHEMSLTLDEQDPEQIESLFNELDELTRDVYLDQKKQIDKYLSKFYNVSVKALMPWHYQDRFFQEAPKIFDIPHYKYYNNKDIVKLAAKFYKGIGLPIDSILLESDLYEKEEKYQHAYCADIDKAGDVRIVCNIEQNISWMSTLLHEAGHAVYYKYMDPSTPYFLREQAHTFTTEAIAMLFGRFAFNPQWLNDIVKISKNEKNKIEKDSHLSMKLDQLVFSRWCQVMFRFEKSMYENPDRNLTSLWWDLVEEYQGIKWPVHRIDHDWATKIHIATVPCYYHNYMLGEILASQFMNYISKEILNTTDIINTSFVNETQVGDYLRKSIFEQGKTLFWDEMIEMATGEKLTTKYFAEQFFH